jgi:defect-in-organelle-trafficking protein DotA
MLFKVIEAIVASPIVAVALIQATDDDFGKAEAATTMLLSVVLKPALMVIAFAISIRISAIGIIVYSYAMSAFLSYSQFTFTSSSFLLDKLLAYLMLNQFTIYMVVAIVSRSFSIIYQLPDQVFSWIGERGDQADVRSILHETKNGAEQGIKMMSELFNIGIGISKVTNKAFKQFSEAKGSGG